MKINNITLLTLIYCIVVWSVASRKNIILNEVKGTGNLDISNW